MSEVRQVLDVFQRALGLPDAERAAFLDDLSDASVREEVRLLLGLHADLENSGFMAGISAGRAPGGVDEYATLEVGPYKILEPIGRGGMAVVYLAEQRAPVWRRVAIKILRTGIDSVEALARFQLEQQALAAMDHPHIAKILDSGTTAAGRPYFVMEHVPGIAITEFCWKRRLSLESRIELFLQVCSAIEHAHQKGIIHRDIKPSNILVADDQDAASARVIDFGVAKTMHRLIQETLHTRRDQLIGTPEYMSPEQFQTDNTSVDTRSDVYSLGVLLYEMLAGVPPFRGSKTGIGALAEVREAILHSSPRRPSTVGTEASDPGDGSMQSRQLRGDIDWILLRALEKDRHRRYGTVQELAEDLRRHLRNEPVSAGPPNAMYRIGKFVRRHRAAVLLGTLLLISGVIIGAMLGRVYQTKIEVLEEGFTLHQQLLEGIVSPMMTFDGESGQFLTVNDSALELFRMSREQFLTRTVLSISAEPAKTGEAVNRLIAGQMVKVDRRLFRRGDGTTFAAAVFSGIYRHDGQTIGVGIVRPLEGEDAETDGGTDTPRAPAPPGEPEASP